MHLLIFLGLPDTNCFCDNISQDLIHILRKQILCLGFNNHVFYPINYADYSFASIINNL